MPKQKWEISAFTKGIIGSAAEGDIPVDAAAYSLNIDPNSEDGTLKSINTDTILSSGSGFQEASKQTQTITILKTQEPDSSKAVDSMAEHTDTDTVKITTASSHGLSTGNIIKFTGTTGDDIDLYDGIKVVEVLSSTEFRIPDYWVTSKVTDGTYQIVETSTTLHYKSITIGFETVDNKYFLYFDSTAPDATLDEEGLTGVAVSLGTTHTKTHIAETIKSAINSLSDVTASFTAGQELFTASCSEDGACSLFLSSDRITVSTTNTGYGTPFQANEMVMNHEGKGVYTIFGVDFSENALMKWEDIYDSQSRENLDTLATGIIHDNVSSMQSRDKAVHIGLGYGSEFITQWAGNIDREQLNVNYNGWTIASDRLEPPSTELSPLNFDIMCATPMYDNNTAFDVKQSYHASVSGLNAISSGTPNLASHLHTAAGKLYSIGDNDSNDINEYGKANDTLPKIGWTFKITDAYDTSDAKLKAAKRKHFYKTDDSGANPIAGDVFMVVDQGDSDNDPSPILEYIGNTDIAADASGDSGTGEAAFFMATQEGSTSLFKISTSISTDSAAGLTNQGRYESVDLSEILNDASGISSIQQCRSPLVSGNTSSQSLYLNSGDGTIDKEHVSYQYCRALHGVYWIGCYSGNLYRINTMDFHSQHSNDTYKGIKLDAVMELDYGEIGKSIENESDTGKFKHWYGSVVGASSFFNPYNYTPPTIDSNLVPTEIDDYNSTWRPKPRNSRISSIVETWMNNPSATVAQHNAASRYAYDDDSDRDGTGDNIYPSTGYMSHHHATSPGSDDPWEIGTDKTMKITSTGTGTDVGQILTGYIKSDGDGHADYIGNTIVNRVRGKNQFDVIGTHNTSNDFPFYSCKVWVLFSKNNLTEKFNRWDMMLFNFYPVTGDTANKVLMYDRTPPYDEVDVMNTSISNSSHPPGEFTHEGELPIQKSTMIFGKHGESSFDSQSHNYGNSFSYTAQPSSFGIIRRDGSCVNFMSYAWSNSFNFMGGPVHHQFGYHIGYDGRSNGTKKIREIRTVPNTLTSNIARNYHGVRFLGYLTGSWCVHGMSHADRRTLSSDGIKLGYGSFHDADNKLNVFKVTDTGSKSDDARCYAAWYEEHDGTDTGHGSTTGGINHTLDHHYSDGGRFKKRRIMGSDYDELYKDGIQDSYSTYDGTTLTNKTIPFVNSAVSTVYHGQVGDFLYIDRKWLSSEPLTGSTTKRLLGQSGAENSAWRGLPWANDGLYSSFTKTKNGSNVRFYKSNGQQINEIRGIGTTMSNTDGCRNYYIGNQGANTGSEDVYDSIPGGHSSNHAASCRQNQMMISLPKGQTSLIGTTAGTGYNVTHVNVATYQLFDLNRFPPSWEITHPDSAYNNPLIGDSSDYATVRSMDELEMTDGTSFRLFLSSTRIQGEDSSARISTSTLSGDEFFDNNIGGGSGANQDNNPNDVRGSNGATSSLYTNCSLIDKRDFPTSPKVVSLPLITHYATDTPTDNWGKFWNAGYMPATDSDAAISNSQLQFICPLDTQQYDLGGSEFDSLATIANYTTSTSLISLASGVSGLITEFPASANIKYKVSLLYDGFQESPLSSFFYDFDQTNDMESMSVTIRLHKDISNLLSPRVTHIVVYRKNNISDMYRMVEEIPLKPDKWDITSAGDFTNTFVDRTRLGSYEALTGINESVLDTSLNYELSCQLNDSLFVAKAYHSELKEDGEKYIFKSKAGKYSTFDVKNDYVPLPTVPTAIVGFNGKIYAFDRSNTYRIDPNAMIIEDQFTGIGCLSPKSIAVTEYGMCFADANNIYLHDSTKPTPIAANIMTLAAYQGFDIGWKKAVAKSEDVYDTHPIIIFDGESSSYIVMVLGSCEQNCNPFVSRAWVYNILKNRWDYWEAPKTVSALHGDDGKVLLSDGNFLYNYKGGTSAREWKWMSKKITGGKETSDKVFHRIRFTGDVSINTLSNPPKWNDDVVAYLDGEIQQLTLMNTKYIKSFSGCFFNGAAGGAGTSMSATDGTLYVAGLNASSTIGGKLPSVDSYVMLDDEIMLVTAQPTATSLTVTRGQMGTTAAIHTSVDYEGTEGIENQRLYNISPCIKLPSKCKGKNLQVYLQNQKGTIGSLSVDLIIKQSQG
tara:strand:+ start:525 stop:6836 length:6312 start_codon:yes stop_codon:yes gene_type:complete